MKRTFYVVYEPISKRFHINRPSDRLYYRISNKDYKYREIFTDDIEKCKIYLTERIAQNAAKIVNDDYDRAISNLKYYIDRDEAILNDLPNNKWLDQEDIDEMRECVKIFDDRIGHVMQIRTTVEVRKVEATLKMV